MPISSRPVRRARATAKAAVAALGLSMLAAPFTVASAPTASAAEGDVNLNLLLTNDFHGRINNNTVKWAWNIENLRATTPADGGLLIGAGDLIGASEFASSSADDQPTIDVMNEIGLDASAVGNHEFDQGWADLRDDVLGGVPDGEDPAAWEYLGANVYAQGTSNPVLPEYMTADINGVSVAVVGAVTQETSSLVSPGGIADIDFGNPIDAVNRVAGELSDGDAANGEADVIVATFHQGAAVGPGSSYAAEVAKGGEFAQMANLDPAVNVVFNGHTHQVYAWDAPVTGGDLPTRPFLQTGSYAANVGQVQLTYNTLSDKVTGYTVRNVATPTTGDNATLASQYPTRLNPINETVKAALAAAAAIGNQPVGSITGDITRAAKNGSYVDGKYVATVSSANEDRGSESAMGDLVANSLRDGLPADQPQADIGIVNPGGLRADLLYAGDTTSNPANTNGVVTYAEANAVLPFVNNVWLVRLTGAQLKAVLEQQWQPAGSSRPFLHLGLSDNVKTTLDPSQPVGSRVTSVKIGGQPLDPAKVYTVSTFSFLGEGGDNFTAFRAGSHQDTGLVDRDLWISYLKANAGISPSFDREQVQEQGLPGTVSGGQAVSFTLGQPVTNGANGDSRLNMSSVGAPENTTVVATAATPAGPVALGTFPVVGGVATVSFTVPASVPEHSLLSVVAQPSGTTVAKGTRATVSATAEPMTFGTPGEVRATVAPASATGTVTVLRGTQVLGTAPVTDGTAVVPVGGKALTPGRYVLTVRYSGDDQHSSDSTTVQMTVLTKKKQKN